jgi:hypothetical protein
MSGLLKEKVVVMVSFLSVMSSKFVNKALSGRCLKEQAFFLPQVIHGLFLDCVVPDGASRTPGKNQPPRDNSGSSPAACWSSCRARPIQLSWALQA